MEYNLVQVLDQVDKDHVVVKKDQIVMKDMLELGQFILCRCLYYLYVLKKIAMEKT